MLKPDTRWLLVILLVAALLFRQGLAVMLLGLLGLALVTVMLWSRWALRRVSYERHLSSDRAFVGDELTLTLRVANRKLLGLPSVQIDESVPDKLTFDAQLAPHGQPQLKVLRRWTALKPYEAVAWQIPVRTKQRGLFWFGPTHLEATDPFGLEVRELDVADRTRLIVYPQLLTLPHLNLRAQHPVGDVRAPRQLLTDPSRTIGVRDYHRDDPFNAIHWGATARRGELQTRMFEPTTALNIAIVLNLDTFEHPWQGVRYDLIEQMISAAASVATAAARERLPFGLYTNGAPADSGQLVRIAPNHAPAQLPLVLEALAKLVPYSVTPFPNLLRLINAALPWGATIVLISALPSDAILTAVLRLTGRGRRVVWLLAGDDPPPRLPNVEVYPLAHSGEQWAEQPVPAVTAAPQ